MSKKKHSHRQPGQPPQPNWQPIEMLSIIGDDIDGMLEADKEQYELLSSAKDKPWVLDDYAVHRVKDTYTRQKNDFPFYDEQLKRWSELPTLTDSQRAEVTRLQEQMKQLRENNQKVLELAEELAKGTFEKQMAKSDAELGLEMLMRMFDL